jgi:ERF superfamily protein
MHVNTSCAENRKVECVEVKTMKISLNCRKDFLCVVIESEAPDGSSIREWYPVYKAERAEVETLCGRPLTNISSTEGVYVDEEGNVYELANHGDTKPLEVEQFAPERKSELKTLLEASLNGARASLQSDASGQTAGKGDRGRGTKRANRKSVKIIPARREKSADGITQASNGAEEGSDRDTASLDFARLNLRQKLALVRRRLAYVQKRGYNQRSNYNYVTAADIAGAVGDILAELGVVVIPRLESISHEPARTGRAEIEHVARVVMNYTFMDVDTAEEITVKVAGEGLDPGDKAPYKAMTGALKYALLQSFLLATGDDPEEERADLRTTFGSERLITAEQARQLQGLIEETGTELERVLAYYKLSSLEQMSEATYQRALELLNRKKARQTSGENAHAPN